MKKIRLGVLGTGIAFEEIHAPTLLELNDQFEVVALYNRTQSRAERVAGLLAQQTGRAPAVYADAEALLARDDIDAVDVAVPINLTAQIAMQALKRGKHVFAEKPIADSMEDGRALIHTALTAKKVLAVGEQFRYLPKFHQIHALVESGAIGDPLVYRLNDMHYLDPSDKFPSTAWRREGNFTGGYLIDGGVHTVAGMRAMVGSPVVEVHGFTSSFNPRILSNQEDTLLLNLKFANGMVGQMALGYGAIDRDARRPKVYGRDGTLVLFGDHIELWGIGKDEPTRIIPLEGNTSGIREEWLDFHNAITTDQPLRFPPEEALADLQIILAGLESAKSKQVVRLM